MVLTLREWRKVKEISLQKMADACDVHVNTYMRWESNPKCIPIGKAQVMSMVLDVPIDEISFVGKSTKCRNE